ncbi:uncharacterized protein LOC109711502 isoform X3 [Ananas comosus]|uniref:Uncharacterized protein LOC109711502 isoform X3 n=1 Tax=Ananas comosus TaxID=4615 RepID=A0A6P5F2L0_ANACO|nr:uncharacterized protein LOC109711502 isoform X3 [Ananas comosus]
MANAEPQKQLLSLIRDFATEKSRGERRVSDLRKRLVELQYDLDSANSDLASAKRAKEMVEEELQGSQAHLAMTDASMLVIEGRIYRLQEEISKVGSDLAALKREEDVQRDDFINRMSGLNVKIRHFREMVAKESLRQPCHKIPLDNVGKLCSEDDSFDSENIIKNLEVEIKCIDAEMLRLESEYQKELHDHHEVCRELADIERKRFLVEAVMGETKQLQELAGQQNWRRYMLHLGRSCARGIHVLVVALTTWES